MSKLETKDAQGQPLEALANRINEEHRELRRRHDG